MSECLKAMPDGWHIVELSEILQYEQPYHYIVLSEEYNDVFGIPVLTAGKSFCLVILMNLIMFIQIFQ